MYCPFKSQEKQGVLLIHFMMKAGGFCLFAVFTGEYVSFKYLKD